MVPAHRGLSQLKPSARTDERLFLPVRIARRLRSGAAAPAAQPPVVFSGTALSTLGESPSLRCKCYPWPLGNGAGPFPSSVAERLCTFVLLFLFFPRSVPAPALPSVSLRIWRRHVKNKNTSCNPQASFGDSMKSCPLHSTPHARSPGSGESFALGSTSSGATSACPDFSHAAQPHTRDLSCRVRETSTVKQPHERSQVGGRVVLSSHVDSSRLLPAQNKSNDIVSESHAGFPHRELTSKASPGGNLPLLYSAIFLRGNMLELISMPTRAEQVRYFLRPSRSRGPSILLCH
ncbi:hypothetical protein C8R47DRAFT_1131545 [Mycena vitilis]|nr:hypothetical protein C8R47DRAFT_1131545 [Mycena vitilis]